MIPRFKPWLNRKELFAIFRRNSGAVTCFENQFAKQFDATDAVAFSYGRSALWAFFQALKIKETEIIMPAYTCSVVAHAISLSGNSPVFIDINLNDYNMHIDDVEKAINKNTSAIVATHLFGYPMDLDRLEEVIRKAEHKYGKKIWLIQDCAHSFGSEWKGRKVCASGDVALYGLNISKMMTSIFGGMLTFQDPVLAEKIRKWRDEKYDECSWKKSFTRRLYLLAVYVAFNETVYGLTWWLQEKTSLLDRFTKAYHLDDKIHFPDDYLDKMMDVEAAVGIEQLKKYPEIIRRRKENAKLYIELFQDRPADWILPPLVEGATYSHFVVRVDDRKSTVSKFSEKGIHLGELIQYSVPELSSYKNVLRPKLKHAFLASNHVINLPIYSQFSCPEKIKDAYRRIIRE